MRVHVPATMVLAMGCGQQLDRSRRAGRHNRIDGGMGYVGVPQVVYDWRLKKDMGMGVLGGP